MPKPMQVPQSSTPPQPSLAIPQLKPCSLHVIGTQPSASAPASPPELLEDVLLVATVAELVELEVEPCVVGAPPEPEPEPEPEDEATSTVLPHAATAATNDSMTGIAGFIDWWENIR
jgi:hypothetical protein